MTTTAPTTQTAVPAGWYPDPAGGDGTRWWDGAAWTAHTTSALPGLAELAADPADGRFGPNDSWIELGDPNTRWAWLLAFSPLIWAVVAGLGQGVVFSAIHPQETAQIIVLGVFTMVLGLVPGWIFAELDRRTLTRRNYDGLPSILWMLLIPPFAYLLRRRRAVRLEGERTAGLDLATLIVGILTGLQALAAAAVLVLGVVLMGSMFGTAAFLPGGSLPSIDPTSELGGSSVAGTIDLTTSDLPGAVAAVITNYIGPQTDCSEQAAQIGIGTSFVCKMTYSTDPGDWTPVFVHLAEDGTVTVKLPEGL
jgi:hypothetical protein